MFCSYLSVWGESLETQCCVSLCLTVLVFYRALLEYYRQKISQYDSERDELLGKLEQYKCSAEELVSLLPLSA